MHNEAPAEVPTMVKWAFAVLLVVVIIVELRILFPDLFKPTPALSIVKVQAKSSLTNTPLVIQLPYEKAAQQGEKIDFLIVTTYEKKGKKALVHITPDDCILVFKVNGADVKPNEAMNRNRCNYSQGFEIDLAPYLKPGSNAVLLSIQNGLGPMGLKFVPQ